MLTIFTIPKPFIGHNNIIQRNAIRSWLKVLPGAEIFLFGDDQGVKEVAEEFGIKNIPDVKKDEFNKPLLDSIFNSAKSLAKNDILVNINADIILLSDIVPAVKKIHFPLFLMAGRRWDLDVKEEINFNEKNWSELLLKKAKTQGKLHGFCATDYLIFPKNLPHNLPSFAVGVAGWDNWLIYHIRSLKIPVIDATKAVTIIHQNHDYSYSSWGKEGKLGGRIEGPQLKRNLALTKSRLNMMTLIDANWIIDSGGLKKPPFPRIIFAKLSLFYFWRFLRSFRRKLREVFSI